MKQMIKRLTRWFQLDMERYSVRVDLLYWKPSSPRIWELAHVRTTTAWIKWLRWCRHHGTEFVMLVQPYEKEVYESSEVGDSSASATGNVEVLVSTFEQPVMGEIAAKICEDRDALVGEVS